MEAVAAEAAAEVAAAWATEPVNGSGPGAVAAWSAICGEAEAVRVVFGSRCASAMPTTTATTATPAPITSASRRRHHGGRGRCPPPLALTSVRGGGPAGGSADPVDVGSAGRPGPPAPEDCVGCGPERGPEGGPGTCPEGGGLDVGPEGGPGGGPGTPDDPEEEPDEEPGGCSGD